MRKIVFELCAETVEACVAGEQGGADRIELCSGLSEGGLTPSHGLIRRAVARCALPVHVLLRPRGSDFVYTSDEFEVMREDLLHACSLGAAGFVLGLLDPDGGVDVQRTGELVRLAHPLEVTFHRAFDCTATPTSALEAIIDTGCGRVLTSGGAPSVHHGAESLARLVEQAAGRIHIAAGGGLRIEDAAALASFTGAQHFHGSLRKSESARDGRAPVRNPARAMSEARTRVHPEDVRAMIEALRRG